MRVRSALDRLTPAANARLPRSARAVERAFVVVAFIAAAAAFRLRSAAARRSVAALTTAARRMAAAAASVLRDRAAPLADQISTAIGVASTRVPVIAVGSVLVLDGASSAEPKNEQQECLR
jgi:hypothetical protein